jgi:GH25 family lysozyme M1 (1,4-beta-N-acetylmuramidase)
VTDPLVCDVYEFDLGGRPNVAALKSAGPPWDGLVLKATEGTRYAATRWLSTYWSQASALNRRGTYLYVHFDQDPIAQAELYIRTMSAVGGLRSGDLPPMVDVERAGNSLLDPHRIVDCVSKIAARLRSEYGVGPTLYGGELLRSLGVRDHMGCDRLWIARYTATLPASTYRDMGWASPFAWQYDGDGQSHLAGYPQTSPMGRCDISAMTDHAEYARARIP